MDLTPAEKQKSLRNSTRDGIAYSVMMGFGENFFVVFAIALGASNLELGLLSSLPLAIGSLAQLFSNNLIKLFNSRKKFVIVAAMLQALTFLPITLLAIKRLERPDLFIVCLCFYWLFVLILGPAWTSWMGDLVDAEKRGSYFGTRNRICGIIAFSAFMVAGFLLEYFQQGKTHLLQGFAFIFIVAFSARLLSIFFLSRQREGSYNTRIFLKLTPGVFIKTVRTRPFGFLILFLWLINFSINLSAPFFAPFMLKEMQLSYSSYTLINATILIVKYLFMPIWGKAADTYGTRKVLILSTILMPLMPLLWTFPHNVYTLILLHVYCGFVWAGFELSAFNFLFDTTSREERVMYLAYYNAFNGLLILSASLLGGVVVHYFTFLGSHYKAVFLASAVLRALVGLLLLPRLKEVRIVQHISYRKLLFKVLTIMPGRGAVERPQVLEPPAKASEEE